jgi:glyoxalase superfamily protein
MAGVSAVRWMSVFADVPEAFVDRELAYWADITGASRGRPEGEHGEFVPLVPDDGDRVLWVQIVGRGVGGWHLDLHVPEPTAAAGAAVAAGAVVVEESESLVTLESPGGQPFCLVAENRPSRRRPPPWPSSRARGRRSLADQLCLDIPASRFDGECEFWAELTGWPRRHGDLPEFDRLIVPGELPLRILLQRLGDDDGAGIRAHLDLSSDNRAEETLRHERAGGRVVVSAEQWTTLRDPAGLIYCITDRTPAA